MTSRTFWVVWCPTSGPPTYRHSEECSARKEAERLAGLNPGEEFFVLRSTGMAKKVSVVWVDHEIPDIEEIPF